MPAPTYYQPIEAILNGNCDYEYYNHTEDTFSKTSRSRICHVELAEDNEYNKDIALLIFTIRNQSGAWKIHSEGIKRMDPGAMVPLRNATVKLAKEKGWKFIAVAVAGEDTPNSENISQYVVSIESYTYGDETVGVLTEALEDLNALGNPDFHRFKTDINGKEYSLAFIKKTNFVEYLTYFDDRPYSPSQIDSANVDEVVDEYTYLSKEWFHEKGNEYLDDDLKAKKAYEEFQSKYSIEYLKNLHGEEMLKAIFLGITDDNLCNALEFDSKYTQFGSISGGTSYKYYLYFSKNEGTWRTSFGNGGKRACTVEEAIEIGTQIRDALVLGIEAIIEKEEFSTIGDYTEVLNTLETIIPDYVSRMWVLKYFHMMFPNVFPNFYNESWQRFVLCNLGIVPSDSQFIRMGQINLFVKECEISNYVFSQVFYENFGSPKTFFRIGTGEDGCYFNEWKEQEYAAIGWNELGDLSALYENEEAAKATIIENLKEDYNYQPNLASKKYKEINNFYSAVTNETYVVAMNGQKILGIGLIVGNYYYDDEKDDKYAHCRKIKWVNVLSQPQTLPNPNEGKLTTFYPLVNGENLCFLYDLINHSNVEENLETAFADAEAAKSKVTFNTGYTSEFARNRILFGAPGTGKSFTLNGDRKEILYGDREADETKLDLTQYGEYERVTFHPDYSYANFVGTYKPVPCKDESGKDGITYEYVPGPFMRTYVKALLNSKTETPKPYLLIIEEINRANVAAVFGDVFQLLDRDENEVSEYPIQASEDMKKYLAKALGGDLKDYAEIRIPDNMFIWATMNSADQGVFPMDTAFKRRWDFTYLGIDDSEDGISGKTVVLGKGKQNSRIVEWNELRKAINDELLKYKVNEDKLMGPYFISKKNLPEGKIIDPEEFSRIFKNKVIMYLFDDAAKQKRTTLFEGCEEKSRNQYSKICNEFDEKGVLIFGSSISDKFTVIPEDDEQ